MLIRKNNISAEKILSFYRECDALGIENHGLLISQSGETLFENYVFPYSAEIPHTLFSVTKSLVSTAVGFAVDEGLITLDTRIYKFFPDYEQSRGTEKITVRDLLTMHSGKKFSFLQDMTGDYVEIFLKSGFRKQNGFLYSNNDVHVLSAVLQRITGETVADYLMPRLFEPLGIEKPEWETDCRGVCVGGTGAYLTLRSLVRIMQCYVDGGKYNGNQIIPEFWTSEATRKQTEINVNGMSENGYGYLFWTYGDSFCMNGLYGQLIFGYPVKKAVIGYTNCAIDDVPLIDVTRKYLFNSFETENNSAVDRLENYLSEKDAEILKSAERGAVPVGEYSLCGLSKTLSELFFPARLIPRAVTSSMAKRPVNSFDRFSFREYDGGITVSWYEENERVDVNCGLNGVPGMSECSIMGYKYLLWSYGWWKGNRLSVALKPINTLATLKMSFRFEKDELFLSVTETPSFPEFILHNINQVSLFNKSKVISAVASGVMKILLQTADIEMKFVRK